MARERLTWDFPSEIAKSRRASAHPATPDEGVTHPAGQEDPEADAYENGDTSSWGEDVHPGPYRTSKAPAVPMDEGSYAHPATQPGAPGKNAAAKAARRNLIASAEIKASKCIRIATALLGSDTSVSLIEDQAGAFMHMPDAHVAETLLRLEASSEDPEVLLRKMLAEEEDEDEKEEVAEEKSAKKATDKMAEVLAALASLSQQVASMKRAPVAPARAAAIKVSEELEEEDEDEKLLASMEAEEEKEKEEKESKKEACGDMGVDQEFLDMESYEDPMGMAPNYGGIDDLNEEQELMALYASEEEKEEADKKEDAAEAKKQARLASQARPQQKKASVGARSVGSQVRVASGGEENELSNLWASSPDVSDIFGGRR